MIVDFVTNTFQGYPAAKMATGHVMHTNPFHSLDGAPDRNILKQRYHSGLSVRDFIAWARNHDPCIFPVGCCFQCTQYKDGSCYYSL